MKSLLQKNLCELKNKNKFPTKSVFRIFDILKIDRNIPFGNLFVRFLSNNPRSTVFLE